MPGAVKRHGLILLAGALGLIAAGLAGGALWWIRTRPPADPLAAARAAYARGDWETASAVAREQLRASGDDLDAARLLARSLIRLGRDAQAMSLFERLGAKDMQADDLHLLGIALSRSGNARGASEVWEQVLKLDPDHPDTLYELGRFHLENDRPVLAAKVAGRLEKHPPWEARAAMLLGKAAVAQEQPARAADAWQRAITLEEARLAGAEQPGASLAPPAVRKDLIRVLLRARRPSEARAQLGTILDAGPDPEASWLLSRAYLQEGDIARAKDALGPASSFADANPTLPEPAPLAGAASCASCHPEQYQAQQHSRHSRTFHHAAALGDLVLPRAPFPDPARPEVLHTLRKVGDRIEQETHTRSPDRLFQAVVDYAFGSGDRGKTLVGHAASGTMFELRLSVYGERTPQLVWDVTSGHNPHPDVAEWFLGMRLGEDGVRRCFACHVTSPEASLTNSGPAAADHSIGCEKCHGPGGNHLLAMAGKFPDYAIARPSLVSGSRVVQICAQCHSPRGKPVEPNDPTSVRSQGTTLTWSRCYTESKDRLDCVTCHDPHRNVETSASHYESKCLVCHPSDRSSTADRSATRLRRFDLAAAPHASACPVNPTTGCISCHMPTVRDVIPHSPFTDHFIRVHPKPERTAGK